MDASRGDDTDNQQQFNQREARAGSGAHKKDAQAKKE